MEYDIAWSQGKVPYIGQMEVYEDVTRKMDRREAVDTADDLNTSYHMKN
jgi:hypothetical protein